MHAFADAVFYLKVASRSGSDCSQEFSCFLSDKAWKVLIEEQQPLEANQLVAVETVSSLNSNTVTLLVVSN